ncbi:DUF805 domain-containing protein [Selenomonas sp. F0473]|uniref:DUF805 domain-containing protein n=1 Tax=Selenomonas sp. F0473 TaxID=999423 RepID=UPI00029DEBA6|nr:DUF805 domain-containing protein [Selenomonas sp. F0473]EKU71120.1 hypothetical protein HMPREF9161_01214 [Selenomonas sp. F0473]
MYTIDTGIKGNFFNYEGRLNRKRYIFRNLALFGIGVALYVIVIVLFVIVAGSQPQSVQNENALTATVFGLYGLFFLLCLPLTVSAYMLMIRRLHDTNQSGFFCLLNFVPFVNIGLGLYLLFKKGTEGDNDYGSDPLDMTGYVYGGDAPAVPEHDDNPYARTDTAPKE